MDFRGVSVRVVDVNKSYVSYRYVNSNARSRVNRKKFMKDFQEGVLNVVNPELLDKG